MTDTECLDFYDKNIKGNRFHKDYLLKIYPEFMTYIQTRFLNTSGDESVKELIYRIKNNIDELPHCPICGKLLKFINIKNIYQTFCSRECQFSDKGKNICAKIRFDTKLKLYGNGTFTNHEKAVQTCLKKYGVTNVGAVKEVKDKVKQTCLEKYGVDNPIKNKDIREKAINTCIEKFGYKTPFESMNIQNKVKQTCIEKYGVRNIMQLNETKEKIKQTCLKKYGVIYPMQCKDIMLKSFKTCWKLKKSSKSSKKEDEIYNYLITIDKDTQRQYYSDLYPFHCDFYLPNFDIYIEFQGTWVHGKHPFNKDDENDIELLDKWKLKAESSDFYKNAINIWTNTDCIKRQTAKNNNLNYLEIFYYDDYETDIISYINKINAK